MVAQIVEIDILGNYGCPLVRLSQQRHNDRVILDIVGYIRSQKHSQKPRFVFGDICLDVAYDFGGRSGGFTVALGLYPRNICLGIGEISLV